MREFQATVTRGVDAPRERCLQLLADVERYPDWHPDVVREVRVLERDANGNALRAQARLHAALGPFDRDFDEELSVLIYPPDRVLLQRVPDEAEDHEQLSLAWRVSGDSPTTIELVIEAALSVPRLVPVGGVAEIVAKGFLDAAARALR